jgi:hypothetical protein
MSGNHYMQEMYIRVDDNTRYTCEKVINAFHHLGKLLEERSNNELKRREQNANQRPQYDNDPFAPQNYNK